MLDINLAGTWLRAREAGKHRLERQIRGLIILVASMAAQVLNDQPSLLGCQLLRKRSVIGACRLGRKILQDKLVRNSEQREIPHSIVFVGGPRDCMWGQSVAAAMRARSLSGKKR
jgi:NAD(P)-dependent dehydrogenase (short-subunit alcohol dehydrogenase family)